MRYLFLFISAVFLLSTVDAQVRVNLGFNVERQPVWGPTGYDHAEYYYLPDIEAYYYVPQHKYFYYERGRWIGRSSLPYRYRNFDLYHSYKVVVNEPTPYRNHAMYRDKYASFRGRHDQEVIRDSRDSKYYVNPNHPEHNNWAKQQNHDNGKDRGRDNNSERK
jgi:hypothetical protein